MNHVGYRFSQLLSRSLGRSSIPIFTNLTMLTRGRTCTITIFPLLQSAFERVSIYLVKLFYFMMLVDCNFRSRGSASSCNTCLQHWRCTIPRLDCVPSPSCLSCSGVYKTSSTPPQYSPHQVPKAIFCSQHGKCLFLNTNYYYYYYYYYYYSSTVNQLPNLSWFLKEIVRGRGSELSPLLPVATIFDSPGGAQVLSRNMEDVDAVYWYRSKDTMKYVSFGHSHR